MTLPVPHYVAAADLVQKPSYRLSKKDPFDRFRGKENGVIQGYTYYTTARSKFALHCAIIEWLVWRFEGLSPNYSEAQFFLEAAWASNVDVRYLIQLDSETVDERFEEEGKVESTLYFAIERLRIHKEDQFRHTEFMTVTDAIYLVRHVLPDKKLFDAWLRPVLERMKEHYPNPGAGVQMPEEYRSLPDGDERIPKMGLPVPRITFDPDVPFAPEQTPQLIHSFLQTLDHTKNPYLASPEEMVKNGFTKTPYQYP